MLFTVIQRLFGMLPFRKCNVKFTNGWSSVSFCSICVYQIWTSIFINVVLKFTQMRKTSRSSFEWINLLSFAIFKYVRRADWCRDIIVCALIKVFLIILNSMRNLSSFNHLNIFHIKFVFNYGLIISIFVACSISIATSPFRFFVILFKIFGRL